MNTTELTQFVKSKARAVGFDKVGIAKADRVRSDNRLQEWLSKGYHGTMSWMEGHPEKRVDPRVLFPGAKSVIAVALNYYTPHTIPDIPSIGKISRYAWGDDYHDVVKDKLHSLLKELKSEIAGLEGKCCVDTAPAMDKYWAAEAGIGWQGKHSNVITRELGSWVFLGEIFVNVDLVADVPIEDFCGTCNRCIEACPTGAITEPYVIDSSKCISYYTIEFRGDRFPKPISDNLNNWIYGCDICQDVCPWNKKFAEPTNEHSFEPRSANINQDLEPLKAMSEVLFKQAFKGSPIKRTKFSGFIRNICAVLERTGHKA